MSIVDTLERVWPMVASGVAGIVGWIGAQKALRKTEKNEADDEIKELRKEVLGLHESLRVARTDLEIFQRMTGAALEISHEEVTIAHIQELAQRSATSIQEMAELIRTMPLLVWMKRYERQTGRFRMVQCSDFYAQMLLDKPAAFYTGKYDSDVWSAAIAKEFAENDQLAIQEALISPDKKIVVKERVASKHTGVSGWLEGKKWVILIHGKAYVCGLGTLIPDVPMGPLPTDRVPDSPPED